MSKKRTPERAATIWNPPRSGECTCDHDEAKHLWQYPHNCLVVACDCKAYQKAPDGPKAA